MLNICFMVLIILSLLDISWFSNLEGFNCHCLLTTLNLKEFGMMFFSLNVIQIRNRFCYIFTVTVTLRFTFIFVARTKLPVKYSVVNVLGKRYGNNLVKNVRKFEILSTRKPCLICIFYWCIEEKHHIKVFKLQGR